MIGGCYAFEARLEVVGEQPHDLFLVYDVSHIAVDETDEPARLTLGERKLFCVLLNDAHLPVVVDNVEVGGRWQGAELHVEDFLVLVVPVGEE